MNNSSLKTTDPLNGLSEKQIEAAYKHQLFKYTVVPFPRPEIIKNLTSEQIEAAYRYQERAYRVQDAQRHVDDLKLDIDKNQLTDDDYLNIAEYFLKHYDCNIDENTQWIWVIEKYLENFYK